MPTKGPQRSQGRFNAAISLLVSIHRDSSENEKPISTTDYMLLIAHCAVAYCYISTLLDWKPNKVSHVAGFVEYCAIFP